MSEQLKRKTIEGVISFVETNAYPTGRDQNAYTKIKVKKKKYELPGIHLLMTGQKIQFKVFKGEDQIEEYTLRDKKGNKLYKFRLGW